MPFQRKATLGLDKVLALCVKTSMLSCLWSSQSKACTNTEQTLDHYAATYCFNIQLYILNYTRCIQNSVKKTIVDIKQAVAVVTEEKEVNEVCSHAVLWMAGNCTMFMLKSSIYSIAVNFHCCKILWKSIQKFPQFYHVIEKWAHTARV